MNDKELADKIVEFVGRSVKHIGDREPRYFLYEDVADHLVQTPADEFVRDPRVAMALMEKAGRGNFAAHNDGWVAFMGKIRNSQTYKSLPRAINEACCEALQNGQ